MRDNASSEKDRWEDGTLAREVFSTGFESIYSALVVSFLLQESETFVRYLTVCELSFRQRNRNPDQEK